MQNIFHSFPQFVPQKVCLSCDGCCRFKDAQSSWRPKVSLDESQSLVDKIFSSDQIDSDQYIKAKQTEGVCHCTFFDLTNNACSIYKNRPFECQLYPFLLVRKSNRLSICVHLSCPYIQDHRDSSEFQNYAQDLEQYFAKKEVLSFLQRNPLLAGDYSGYEDELEHLFFVG